MKLPNRKDILDYLEGAPEQNAVKHKQILNLLASSPVMREQMLELKRDLYVVSTQIPEYFPDANFAAEISKLAKAWYQVSYNRKFSLRNFYRSREFFATILLLAATLLLLILLLGFSLI